MATKKEIDKDLMYKKIMPTAMRGSKGQSKPTCLPDAVTAFSSGEEAIPVTLQNDTTAQGPSIAHPARPVRNTIFRTNPELQFHTVDPSILINLMERLVAQRLDEAFSKFNCCKCDKCKKDVAAMALNRLPPKYVVASPDQIVELISRQTYAEVLTAIIQAILAVKAHPNH